MIRRLERHDLPDVARLYELVARSGRPTPPPGLAGYFAETFLDHPWADPTLCGYVNVEHDGAITGFIGVHARRLRFPGRDLSLAYCGQLVTDPDVRNRAVGLFLARAFLGGGQDLAVTDTAGEPARRMWTALGGDVWELPSMTWLALLRPVRYGVDHLRTVADGVFEPMSRTVGDALDRLRSAVRKGERQTDLEVSTRPLLPADLVALGHRIAEDRGGAVAYDEPFVTWLLDQVGRVTQHGSLVTRVVESDRGMLGGFGYYARHGRLSDVLFVLAGSGHVDAVVEALVADARARGVALLRGRVEPGLLEPLAARRCLFRFNGCTLVHARDPELRRAVLSGDIVLTRLDGEYWNGHHLGTFV